MEDNDLGGIRMFIYKDLWKNGYSIIYVMVINDLVCI